MPDPVTGIIAGSSIIGGVSASKGASKAAGEARAASDASVAESRRQFDLVRSDTAPMRFIGNQAVDRLAKLYGYGSMPRAGSPTAAIGHEMIMPGPDGSFGGGIAGVIQSVRNARAPVTIDQGTGAITETVGGSSPDTSVFFESPDYQFNLAEGQKAIDRSLVARGRGLSGAGVREGVRYASGMASREYSAFVDRLMQQAGLGSTGIGQSAAAGANAAGNITSSLMNAGNTRASAYMQGAAGVNNAFQGGVSNYLLSRYLGGPGGGVPSPVVGYGG